MTRRTGIPFVVAAPSGTGKTTVCRRVVEEDPRVEFSVSHTTRSRRSGERDEIDYFFVSRNGFDALIEEGAFLEWAEYNRHRYGTSQKALEAPLARGNDVLLEIEIQGAAQVRERRADARLVFLLPPSLERLEARLRGRGTDSEEEIARRLGVARGEIHGAVDFDFAVVNDDLDRCVAEVTEIIAGCRGGDEEALRARFSPGQALGRLSA